MGEAPDKETLGGARMQARAGAVDNVAEDENGALGQIKRFLSYLPSNVWEAPPTGDASAPPDRRDQELLSIVPRDRRLPYKMRRILEAVFDRGSIFELGAAFGRPTITCLARLGGRPVGVLASDPEHYGGGVTADAAEKTARFVDVCDQFHLPMVNLVDVPGFVIGTGAERAGTIRRGARDRLPARRGALALPHGRALQRGGDHRPARHPPHPLRLGGARARADPPRAPRGPEGARPASLTNYCNERGGEPWTIERGESVSCWTRQGRSTTSST